MWGEYPNPPPELDPPSSASEPHIVDEKLGAVELDAGDADLHRASPEDLHRSEQTMILVRWLAVPWVLVQVLSYQVPYPSGYKTVAVSLAVTLAIGNAIIWWLHRSPRGLALATQLALGGLAFDVALISSFVWLYAFDYETQIWAVLAIVPLEGAILLQLRGALGAWAATTAIYAARDFWGAQEHGNPLVWQSITFRMGVIGIVALVAGLMARDLLRQRTKLSLALEEIRRIDTMRAGLVSTLGHDVRSPLTVIRGSIETVLRHGERVPASDRRELLQAADRQARRLEQLATDLLDLARMDEGRLQIETERVALAPLVRQAISYIEGADAVEVSVPEDVVVLADPARLEQVLINLVSNALKHGAPPVSLEVREEDGSVVIAVSDEGPGVAEEEVERLFEPFGKRRKPGSAGYGLAIVKALVDAQGGRVAYHPTDSGGACFEVSLLSM